MFCQYFLCWRATHPEIPIVRYQGPLVPRLYEISIVLFSLVSFCHVAYHLLLHVDLKWENFLAILGGFRGLLN